MKKKPLVSVVMNCFNGEKFLNQAIESLNPNAKTFIPGVIFSPAKKRSSEDIILQLDEKIQRLLDMQCVHNTPICYAKAVN